MNTPIPARKRTRWWVGAGVVASALFGPASGCEESTPGTGKSGDSCASDEDCGPDLECDVHDDADAGTCKADHDDG